MPILYAPLVPDMRLATTLDQRLLVALTDMASIRTWPGAVVFYGNVNGTLSDTVGIRFSSLGGAQAMAPVADGGTLPVVDPVNSSSPIAVARAGLRRQITDLAEGTGSAGMGFDLNSPTLGGDMVKSYDRHYNLLVGGAVATAAVSVGVSLSPMTTDDFYDATFVLELSDNENVRVYCLLHPRQTTNLRESIRGETGAAQFMERTQEMLKIGGQGVVGSWLGVDIFKSSSGVTESGGNKLGGMWTSGALGWRRMIANPRIGAGTAIQVRMDELLVEVKRIPEDGSTDVIGQVHVGLSLIEQARIVGIRTGA